MILFINACVRENSRTKRLADHLLSRIGDSVVELRLSDATFPAVNDGFIAQREKLTRNFNFEHPVFEQARQFAAADQIVIAAPFWDLSFPASLKQYLEQISVVGITFRYTPEGVPEGLCKAKSLFYVTTAGGEFFPEEYGYGYVKALSENFYGIPRVELIKATGLDIYGAHEDQILQESMNKIDVLFPSVK